MLERSRVSDHATPPTGVEVEHHEFRGPLFAQWGEGMRGPALADAFRGVGVAELRRRLGIPTAADRAAWTAMDSVTLDAVAEQARAERGQPWPQALASVFARYVRDGDRRQYEKALDDRMYRLTRAVVTAAATDDPAWLDEAADGAVLMCELSTWSLPAHDDAHARRGFVISDASSPYVDLWAGEVLAQLAVADHVLGERWDATWPGIRERIRHEAEQRVFTPFETRDDLWWLGYWREVNNWNPWILGNIVLAAVLLVDDTERLARILDRALEALDRYVATLPADGAIDEGVSYWWQGAARMLEFLDVVVRITDGALDAAGIPVIAESLRFPMRMQLGGDWYVNVADGRARIGAREPWHVPFRWGSLLGDEQVVSWASGGRRPGEPVAHADRGLPRLMRALSDTAWRDTAPSAPPLPTRVWLPSVQVLLCRTEEGSTAGLTLAAKGGTNDENHNHKDVGSFILASGGRPLLVDIGKPTYTAQTFSAQRYGIRAMQSGWHNAPAPRGLEQGEGPAFAATVLGVPEDGLELDLSRAYPVANGEAWTRAFRLVSAQRAEIVDTWRLDGTAASDVHLIAAGSVEVRGAEVVVTADGRSIRVTTAEGVEPTAEVWELDDPELIDAWGAKLTRLTYRLEASAGSLTTIVEEVRP
ncbi:heparinase II/III domain-containing protein [Humibacter sp.]|uniref:heparinase II/III domain-containing protein n=1 Tax=Humibacter sp. TaxID=1940291 RepID=UPI003F7FE294